MGLIVTALEVLVEKPGSRFSCGCCVIVPGKESWGHLSRKGVKVGGLCQLVSKYIPGTSVSQHNIALSTDRLLLFIKAVSSFSAVAVPGTSNVLVLV